MIESTDLQTLLNQSIEENSRLQHIISLERLKSEIYKDIIESNTQIKISLKESKNPIEMFNELYNLFCSSKNISKNEIIPISYSYDDKKNNYKSFKNCMELADEPTLDEQNNKIVEIDKTIQIIKNDFIDIDEAKVIFDECFENVRRDRTFSKTLKRLKEVRLNIIGRTSIDDYCTLLKNHYDKLYRIFIKEKQLSEKISLKHISVGFSTIDQRIMFFKPYYITSKLEMEELSKFKTCLQISVNFPKSFISFSHDDYFKSFFNYGSCLCTIKECIERNSINIYGFNNIVYIPISKSNENDPFSFYYLKKIDKTKRYWHMDCRLEDLSNKFIDNIKPFLVELFRKIYFDIFSDYDYRRNFLYQTPDIELDFKQLIQNLCILGNPKRFNKYFRFIFKEKASYNATANDIKNFSTDDSSQKRRFENDREIIDPIETVKLLFDNISNEDAVDFYRSNNTFV